MSDYKLSIDIPSYVDIEQHPKTIVVSFETKEEWDAYKSKEALVTMKAFIKKCKAFTKDEVAKAWLELFQARKALYMSVFHPPKNIEPTELA